MESLKTVFLTGSTGFIGKNLLLKLSGEYKVTSYVRNTSLSINENIVIHLAGKAQDLKKSLEFHEYYKVNTEFSNVVFSNFLNSESDVFIMLSSVKAVADNVVGVLTEDYPINPVTHYGKSKYEAEKFIFSSSIPRGKRIYVLRPCMVHGPGNIGNLNLLYKVVNKGFPWPLGAFENKRSFCSVENLIFVIKELMEREDIPSGVYNVCDDVPLSTNQVISILSESVKSNVKFLNLPKWFIYLLAKFGNVFKLPLNDENLQKLTESYVVCNVKIKKAIGKPFPVSSKDGFIKTFNSFR
jgi:nucleoside-diphosphate-sugar epimerase